jgi:signal transduction histidine kinase
VYSLDEAEHPTVERLTELLARAEDRSAWIQDICAALGHYPRLDELLSFIMDRIRLIMGADRATLFMNESDGEHLCSRILTDSSTREIRVRRGFGIAGWVAENGKSINVRDAYRDTRFDPSVDEETGYRTRSVICQPMRNTDHEIIGVVQVLNKRSGYFTVDDELLLSAITNTAAIVIQNRQLYLDTMDRNMALGAAQRKLEERMRHLDSLYELQRSLAQAMALEDVISIAATSLANMVGSYGCAVTVDSNGQRMEYAFSRNSKNAPFELSTRTWDPGIAAKVLQTGEPIRREADVRHLDAARVTGRFSCIQARPVSSIAAVPLKFDGKIIGCVELVDRARDDDDLEQTGFSDEDEKLMTLVAQEISVAVGREMLRKRREMQGRLSAIGHMLSGVIHDTRTPLTIAKGYVQLMARSEDPDRRKALAERVSAQFDHLNEMTREVLAYARGETTIYRRTVHLHILAEELRGLLEQEFESASVDVAVQAKWRGDARLDDGKLKRVIFNLARNAREAMDGNPGTFTVFFDRIDDDLIVDVTDSAGGIPQQIQANLFAPFVSVNKPGGSGLGLAIVKKLVEEHGGSITFETTPGVGTTFRIRLPIEAPASETAAATVR